METYSSLLAAVTAQGGETREVLDPATGERIGDAPVQDVAALEAAIDTAEAAQPAWAALSDAERSAYLNRAADAIEAAAEPLAELLSREQGKPLNGPNARFEVGACAVWTRSAADTPLPVEVIVDDGENYAELHYRPIGVVGAISPWNWPMMISIWQIAPSLRMGNTVVIKPAETTTLSVLALVAVMNQVLPAGVLNIVPGPGSTVGDALTRSPKIGKIMFTGSTPVGKRIIEASAGNVTRLTLELGGNDAGIVLPDVDPKAIAEDLFWGAFINTGQTCAALKRLYVHDSVYDAVVEELAKVAAAVPMGVGVDEQNVLGPLQNRAQFDVVDRLVEAAKASGARVVLGGEPDRDAVGYFYPTTLVADIDPHNDLVLEEQFGPALPIIRYSELDEAVRLANELEVGLGASVWSNDRDEAKRIAARLQAGTVWINSHGGLHPQIPFGGAKQSGYGREFGVEGLKAVAEPQVVSG
ncbi:aldehyde dehydrogenase [Leucobacter sp. OLJS4]|uniref:aldehyde dehydrogenase family protein n=1 Tax=unclassified Leucobacter TaxID=2621730 RepID=UPI000C17BBDD|nr:MULTISPECIES: aldehyde dehydrogenase family protein [unclassified Leucobacter]PII83332.1 aldehyde dehydrogenase [Leucobacter sp. OLCALW19]PII86882.1 aldehyde dehydrogenase [Leucobacter sp. OLTLW20]PII91181.1 aldehyde dehydrogenase [Leucobacter sp. OLAS13]PII98640.1 aldehyde dehydrogenase [Leucobacter sp. OLDS2]PIJ04045.1 aldehyde dehydrogenase [Leucobacter sp. OLIS6]